MEPIRAILFDLGDTLIQFGRVDAAALFDCAVERTYQMWARRQRRMPGFRRYYLHQWFAVRWGYLKQLVLRREMDAMRYIRRACRKLWLEAPDEFFEELAWNWYGPLADMARLEPDTHRTLDALRDAGFRMGIVSNTFVPGFVLDRHLRLLGMLEYFPHRVYSCDVGFRKPDRRIFAEALRRIDVPATQTLFVGDSIPCDILGAERAGLAAVWKRPPHAGALALCDPAVPMVSRLSELPVMVTRLGAQRSQRRWAV